MTSCRAAGRREPVDISPMEKRVITELVRVTPFDFGERQRMEATIASECEFDPGMF